MPLAVYPKCFLPALVVDRTMTLAQWIAAVRRELDVDGLEFHWGFTPATREERLRLRTDLAALGLAAPMMCPAPDFIQRDRSQWVAEVERQRRVIEATAEMGGSYCRVLSGQAKPGVGRDEGLAMAAEAIAACLPTAVRFGVCLTLENHYKATFWEYPEFAQRREDFLELLDRIPRGPNFGVNFDPSNALIAGDDPVDLLEAVLDRFVTMHASDRYFEGGTVEDLRKLARDPHRGYAPFLRHGVIGRGCIDYDGIFALLRQRGFTGWISIEDGDDPAVGMAHLKESAVFLRKKMAAYGLP
ncbi:MAG: sugar phosphate isomerase/epimerase family protein [Opitutales bacterium]